MSGTSLAVAYFLLQISGALQTMHAKTKVAGEGWAQQNNGLLVSVFRPFAIWVVISCSLMFGYASQPLHKRAQLYEGLFIAGTVLLAVAVGFLLARNMPPMSIIPFVMLQSGLLALLWAGQQYASQ